MAIVKRLVKGSKLTYAELDGNFDHLTAEDTAVRAEFAAADDVAQAAAEATAQAALDAHTGDTSGAHADSAISYTPYGTGSEASTVQAKLRQRVSILDFVPIAEHAAIIAGTSTYDCSASLTEALAAFPNGATLGINSSGYYAAVPEIYFPAGKYYFASTIQIKKTVRLQGEGCAITGYSSLLQFAADITGIIVHAYNTIGVTVESPVTTSGSGTVIDGLGIFGTYTSTSGHGIHVRAYCQINNCSIIGFAENGINIVATSGGGGAAEGNANRWSVSNVKTQQNGGHGFFCDGADVNAGIGTAIDSTANGKSGIYDSSFLGNTYIACHTSSNGKKSLCHYSGNRYYCLSDSLGPSTTPGTDGEVWVLLSAGGATSYYPEWDSDGTYFIGAAYRTDNNSARGVFLGCYSESGQPASIIVQPSIVVGGLHGADFDAANSSGMLIGTAATNISEITVKSEKSSSRVYYTKLSESGSPDNAISLQATGDHPKGFQLAKWYETNGTWGAWWADANPVYYVTTNLSTEQGGRGTALAGGSFLLPQGMWLGGAGTYRNHQTRTAAPTTGTYARGDIVYNSAPAAGGVFGWACITAGTPGTWIPFGGMQVADAYTTTNVTTDRAFDADTVLVAELADVVGTLIADLKANGILK